MATLENTQNYSIKGRCARSTIASALGEFIWTRLNYLFVILASAIRMAAKAFGLRQTQPEGN